MTSLISSGEHPFNGGTTTFEFVKVRSAAEESQGGAEAIHNKHRSLNHLCGVISLLLHVYVEGIFYWFPNHIVAHERIANLLS